MPSPVLNDPTPAPVMPAPESDHDLLTPDPAWARVVRTRLLAQHPAAGARGMRPPWPWIRVGFALAVVVLLGSAAMRWTTAPVTSSPPSVGVPSVAPMLPLPTPTPSRPNGALRIVDDYPSGRLPAQTPPPLPPEGGTPPWTPVPAAAIQAGIPFSVTYPAALPAGARLSETWQLKTADDTGVRLVYDTPAGIIAIEQTKPSYPVQHATLRRFVIQEVNINGRYGVLSQLIPSDPWLRLLWVQRGIWVEVSGPVDPATLIDIARSVPTP